MPERRFSGADTAGRVALHRLACVELTLGYGRVARERCPAVDVVGCDFQLRSRAFHVGLGLVDRDAERARVDDEQKVALLDDLSFLEMNGLNEA